MLNPYPPTPNSNSPRRLKRRLSRDLDFAYWELRYLNLNIYADNYQIL